jgi:hypothetical protein
LIEGFPKVAPPAWWVSEKTVHGGAVDDLDGIDTT